MSPLPALLLAALAGAPFSAPSAPALRCLPDDSGFLVMRLRGSLEADLDWRGAGLDCTGMSRPDGRGLRLRFAGQSRGGHLAVVFAVSAIDEGETASGVPVNLTLLDEAGERIYGTRGDGHCLLDRIVQQALSQPGLPPRSYRVTGRGFCTSPARAVDGDGAVLATRFDFAGIVSYREDDGATAAEAAR